MSEIPSFFDKSGGEMPAVPPPALSPIQMARKEMNKSTLSHGSATSRALWRKLADDFFAQVANKETFVQLFTEKPQAVPSSWISHFIESLEASSEQGIPFNQFLSYWRLLPSDIPEASRIHPSLERGIRIAREKRKQAYTDSVMNKAHTNPTAAMKALESVDFTGDVLLEEDIKKSKKTIEDTAEEILIDNKIIPCEYVQVVVLQGDTPTPDHVKSQDHDLIGLRPEQVIEMLNKEKTQDGMEVQNSPEKEKWKFKF